MIEAERRRGSVRKDYLGARWTERDYERFMAKVSIQENGCWEWRAGVGASGYGVFTILGTNYAAHRIAKIKIGGEGVPPHLVCDHLCRNKTCVNPDHIEAVSNRRNALRGKTGEHVVKAAKRQTHCKRGHEYSEENTYRTPSTGRRTCKACIRLLGPDYQRKRRKMLSEKRHHKEDSKHG